MDSFEETEVKSEPEDDYIDTSLSNGHTNHNSSDFSSSDVEIKEEPESENEDNLISFDQPKRKKKKKKQKNPTPEQIRKSEEIKTNRLRKEFNIKVKGEDVPAPVTSFFDLYDKYEISGDIKKNMNEIGYENPTPIQMQAIPAMLEGRQIRACAPTGEFLTFLSTLSLSFPSEVVFTSFNEY